MVILGWLSRFNDIVRTVVLWVAMALVAFAVISLAASALVRNITGTGYGWLIELPPMFLPWAIFPLLGPLLRAGAHISVDVLPNMLGPQGNRLLQMFIGAVAFASSIMFFMAGIEAVTLFRNMGQMTELEFSFPIWYVFLAFPVGFAILGSFALEMLLAALLGKGGHEDPAIGSIE